MRSPSRIRPTLSPAVQSRRDLPLLLLALASAGSSVAALLIHAVGWIRMPYTVSFVTLPGLILLVCLTMWSRRASRPLLFNRLVVGTVGGFVGLVAYDAMRWVVAVALPFKFDAFFAMPAFGTLMTGRPMTSTVAILSGWAYHITNGWTFGVIYSLIAGPARWWWGLIWGLMLEAAMAVVYPAIFQLNSISGFVIVSVIGHAVFGGVVGKMCERYAVSAES